MVNPTQTAAWQDLVSYAQADQRPRLRDLFEASPERADQLTVAVGDLTVDFSKQLVTAEIISSLLALAENVGVGDQIAALLAGAPLNTTEARPALHTALRAPRHETIMVNNRDVVADVHAMRDRMVAFAHEVRNGQRTGATGRPFTQVINLGIGGSDLGPAMAYEALAGYRQPGLRCCFVSNVDAADLDDALSGADPETTLFIVSSKSFSTSETLTNAETARRWLTRHLGEQATSRHMVAISANSERTREFGIEPDNRFDVWDWVGGRYSLDSAIGLSLMLALGPDGFGEFLDGFRLVDEHFAQTPLSENVPVLMGLISLWNRSFLDFPTRAVLPYSHALRRFPAYLQQLEMESNGKQVRADGDPVDYPTAPVIWGEPGTNGQHSFHQLLHQGTTTVPCDFIAFARATPTPTLDQLGDPGVHQELLVANCFAQAEALAFGRTAAEVAQDGAEPELVNHRTFPGNRPSTVIMARQLTPSTLGQLIALYEHQVVVQAMVWGINPFDQWGVELGKQLATGIVDELRRDQPTGSQHDSSTNKLIAHFRSER